MTHSFQQGSAKIYQFPVRVRTVVGRDENKLEADRSPRASGVAVSTGWYHEAAIQDSNKTREH